MNVRAFMNVSHFRQSMISVALGLLVATGANAQSDPGKIDARPAGALRLSLDDAVRRAVENNPDLAIVRLGTEVEAARVSETRSAFTPMFATTLGRSSTTTPPSNFLLGERGVNADDWFSSSGVRQR